MYQYQCFSNIRCESNNSLDINWTLLKKHILFAILNWGLGHATRSIPIIKHLQRKGIQVTLASDGEALLLLRAEFPQLEILELPSYHVTYAQKNMMGHMVKMLPKIFWAIRKENQILQTYLKERNIDGIISDNRYGCYAPNIPSVLMTHQMQLLLPNKIASWVANRLLQAAVSRFQEVWVPDAAQDLSLSGKLSTPTWKMPSLKNIGILTRMTSGEREREYDVAVILSGPEPLRTRLEEILMEQALNLPMDFIFIQGKTHTSTHFRASENIEVISYLTTTELQKIIHASRVIVCRSGYSSIMDLAMLGKKAILIPTPGQPEQEYLADRFHTKKIFPRQLQHEINLEKGIKTLSEYSGIPATLYNPLQFAGVVDEWCDTTSMG